jgi:8-oxo-dGTP pyrophosphatase MutT (NUDIX family)
MRTPKAVPVVLRRKGASVEVLVFAHPEAGTQIVKGTVEPGESVSQAACRELAEESGIQGAECARDLGTWEECPRGQVWHFREMVTHHELPDSWSHFTTDGGGHLFQFTWHALNQPTPATCHPVFAGALGFLRSQLVLPSNASKHAGIPGAA